MKYLSMFATILLVWIAVLIMAITRTDLNEIFQLYFATVIFTIALFVIGFAKK